MAELILKLKRNEQTGKQDLFIDYESTGDTLPFEHEEEHRDLVKRVLEDLELSVDDVSNVYIERQPVETDNTAVDENQDVQRVPTRQV